MNKKGRATKRDETGSARANQSGLNLKITDGSYWGKSKTKKTRSIGEIRNTGKEVDTAKRRHSRESKKDSRFASRSPTQKTGKRSFGVAGLPKGGRDGKTDLEKITKNLARKRKKETLTCRQENFASEARRYRQLASMLAQN